MKNSLKFRNLFFYLYLCAFMGFISCSEDIVKDRLVIEGNIQKRNVIPPVVANMNSFSEILSKAVAANPALRDFLKTEALKTMDNDYDIFYLRSKNEIVTEGKSFRDILLEYAVNEEELTGIEESLPLLTIYVPELPSGFDAGTWDAKNEIPYVANPVIKNDSVNFYYDGGIAFSIKRNEIPGCPTLVVKNNERIWLKDRSASTPTLRSSSGDDDYEFIDEAFDGLKSQPASLRAFLPVKNVSPLLIAAYNEMGTSPAYWQRDHIYYGMTKQTGSTGFGYLNSQMWEKIVSVKFTNAAYKKMADQGSDAFVTAKNALSIVAIQTAHPEYTIGDCLWTEGHFEIKIDIGINNLTGFGATITKYIDVHPRELFDVEYTKSGGLVPVYTPTGNVTSKTYYPDIALITWDLQNNGFGWKFNISEQDEQTTTTQTATVTSEYAANFGMTANGLGKIGLNFGTSAKRTQTNTYTLVTSQGSDDLGTLELAFSDPVITSTSDRPNILFPPGVYYNLFSISNTYVEMAVIPMPKY